MKLTDYYKMAKLPNQKSKLRIDCITSTGGYEQFEQMARDSRDGRFKCYYTHTPDTFSANARRKADMAITNSKNISSIYIPDLDTPLLGYGDVKGTNDALLFLFSDDYRGMEIFIARGLKNHQKGLFTLFVDGELDNEMELLRQQAKPTNVLLPK